MSVWLKLPVDWMQQPAVRRARRSAGALYVAAYYPYVLTRAKLAGAADCYAFDVSLIDAAEDVGDDRGESELAETWSAFAAAGLVEIVGGSIESGVFRVAPYCTKTLQNASTERVRKHRATRNAGNDSNARNVTTVAKHRREENRREENNEDVPNGTLSESTSGDSDHGLQRVWPAKAKTIGGRRVTADEMNQAWAVFVGWVEASGRVGRPGPKPRLTKERAVKIVERLRDGYTPTDLATAVSYWLADPHHAGENDRHTVYDDLETLIRSETKVARALEATAAAESSTTSNSADALASHLAKYHTEGAA